MGALALGAGAALRDLARELAASFCDFNKGNKQLCDTATSLEALFAFSVESRADVDRLGDLAIAHGGTAWGDPQDHGFMYQRSFQDPDGHVWELFWMDESAVPS